jgi:hypothetical protein
MVRSYRWLFKYEQRQKENSRNLTLQRDFDEILRCVGQAFQPAMRTRPQGRLESLPHKTRPGTDLSL